MNKSIISTALLLLVTSSQVQANNYDETLSSLLYNFDTGINADDRNTNDKGCSVYARDQSGMGSLYLSLLAQGGKSALQQTSEGRSITFEGKSYKSKISHEDTVEGTNYVIETYSTLTDEYWCMRALFGGDPCKKDVGVSKTVSKIQTNDAGKLIGFSVKKSQKKRSKFRAVEKFSCY